jgi:hypothetical protein
MGRSTRPKSITSVLGRGPLAAVSMRISWPEALNAPALENTSGASTAGQSLDRIEDLLRYTAAKHLSAGSWLTSTERHGS